MTIIFDGIIYSLQRNGGISRYFDEIINGLAEKYNEVNIIVLLRKDSFEHKFHKNVKIEIINFSFNKKYKIFKYIFIILDKINIYFFLKKRIDLRGAIFHSTYYSTFKNKNFKKVTTVHDFTHEYFLNGFLNFLYKKKQKKINFKFRWNNMCF